MNPLLLMFTLPASAWDYTHYIQEIHGCDSEDLYPLTLTTGESSLPVYFSTASPGWSSVARAQALHAMEIYSSTTALPTNTWTWEAAGDLPTLVHDLEWDTDLEEFYRSAYEQTVQLVWMSPTVFADLADRMRSLPTARAAVFISVHDDDPCDTTRWMFLVAMNTAYDYQFKLPTELSWTAPSTVSPVALNSFPTILAHELGHVVGLGHICNPLAEPSIPCYPDIMHPGAPGVVGGDEHNTAHDPTPFHLSPDMASGLGTLYGTTSPGDINLTLMKFLDGPALGAIAGGRRPRETWTQAWAELANEHWGCFNCEESTPVADDAMLITAGMSGAGCVETEVVFRLTTDEASDCDAATTFPVDWYDESWILYDIEETVPISDRSDNRVMSDLGLDVKEFVYETPLCSTVTLP